MTPDETLFGPGSHRFAVAWQLWEIIFVPHAGPHGGNTPRLSFVLFIQRRRQLLDNT
jgi:hypothetical protein